MLDTPVLFLVFNRPDTTRQVFEAIRRAKPKQLFIAADGPRPAYPNDAGKCRLAREAALQVDWPCQVKTLFREDNLGCKYAVSSAIDWFFGEVPEGIILEDDTLPDASFFAYCQELLGHYRNETKVMHIGGFNHLPDYGTPAFSYRFSAYCHVWGWATWRRAWKQYAVELPAWQEYSKQVNLEQMASHKDFPGVWRRVYQEVYDRKVDTWDLQWLFAVWKAGGCAVTPVHNLVHNIGIGHQDGTHTLREDDSLSISAGVMPFPLVHDPLVRPGAAYDAKVFEAIYRDWGRESSFKQVLHDKYYNRLPESIKTLYRTSIKGFFKNS